jgi:uncharacterized membrane protein
MNVEFVVLRLIHIVFGVFWAGSALFMAIILEPRLRALGPAIQRPVMGAIVPMVGRLVATSAVITMVAGIYMALRLRWGHLDQFLDTGWGWAILIGFVASVLAFSSGITTLVLADRVGRLGREIEGRPPTPEEAGQMQRLAARLPRLGRTTAALVLIAVGAMASARFV